MEKTVFKVGDYVRKKYGNKEYLGKIVSIDEIDDVDIEEEDGYQVVRYVKFATIIKRNGAQVDINTNNLEKVNYEKGE